MPELHTPPDAKIVFEPHGFVHLQKFCAEDLDVVNNARVSFAKQSDWEYVHPTTGEFIEYPELWVKEQLAKKLKSADEAVLRFLLKNKHGTPFEANFFKFHVRAPIFVFREWHRHRIGISINEESARYSPLQPDFWIPETSAVRSQTGKPGRYTFETVSKWKAEYTRRKLAKTYRKSYKTYSKLMDRGIAKEIARSSLPLGIYSQMIWCCNARSLMNFLALRNSPTAQAEIREYSVALEEYFSDIMPITHDEFVKNGRVAP